MDKYQYLKDLKKRQKQHLKNVKRHLDQNDPWIPCVHDSCTSCHGTGIKIDGSGCVHYLYCSCPKCSPSYSKPVITWIGDGIEFQTSGVVSTTNNFKVNGSSGYLTYTETSTGYSEEINS